MILLRELTKLPWCLILVGNTFAGLVCEHDNKVVEGQNAAVELAVAGIYWMMSIRKISIIRLVLKMSLHYGYPTGRDKINGTGREDI